MKWMSMLDRNPELIIGQQFLADLHQMHPRCQLYPRTRGPTVILGGGTTRAGQGGRSLGDCEPYATTAAHDPDSGYGRPILVYAECLQRPEWA